MFWCDDRMGMVGASSRFDIAEEEKDHHSLIILEWERIAAPWWVLVVKGLDKDDFIIAARKDQFN